MNMFGLEGSGFIIAISVCLLLIGAVVYYFNTRVASLEKALVRQNQVLADFIQNVRASHIEGRNMQMQVADQAAGNGATTDAVDAARAYFSSTVPQEKVDVSDDEDGEEDDFSGEEESELDSDDEEEGDSQEADSNSSSNTDDIKVEPVEMSQGAAIIGTMVVDMTGMFPVESVEVNDGPQVIELLDDEDNEGDQSDNAAPIEVKQEPVEDKKVIKLSEVDDLDAVSSSLGSSLDDEEEDDGVTIDSKQENVIADFSKLKVAKLKEMASKKGIKNATKMKKAELVAALEAKK
jgi:hypothetical protein